MSRKTCELLITFQADAIRLVEVAPQGDGRPYPVQAVLIPLSGADEPGLAERIKEGLVGVGITLRRATLVVGRRELIVRPDEVPEAITLKPTGYAAAAIGRSVPMEGAGEIAGSCIPLGPVKNGKVACLNLGARIPVIEPWITLLNTAGIQVTRIIPATVGTMNALQWGIPHEIDAIGVRVESNGVELIGFSAGLTENSWWFGNPGIIDETATFRNSLAEFFHKKPEEIHDLYFLNGIKPSMELGIHCLLPWFTEAVPCFETGRGLRMTALGGEWSYLIASAGAPAAADMRTPQMLAQEAQRKQKQVYTTAAVIALAVLLLGAGVIGLAGWLSRTELEQVNRRYEIVAAKADKLAAMAAKNQNDETKLATWGQALAKDPAWAQVLLGLENALPPDVSCKSLKLDAVRGCMVIGTASAENTVTDFSQSLAKQPAITKAAVSYIRVAAGSRGGVEFAIGFTVKTGGVHRAVKAH